MKHAALSALLAGLVATAAMPVLAQSASQIASVKARNSCVACNLFQADFDYENISGLNLSRSRLIQSDLTASTADRTNFSGANLSISNLSAIRATGANFTRADLSRTSMVGGYFGGSNFAGANLSGANLSGSDFGTARGLTQGQLNSACGDAATVLPRGLRVPACR